MQKEAKLGSTWPWDLYNDVGGLTLLTGYWLENNNPHCEAQSTLFYADEITSLPLLILPLYNTTTTTTIITTTLYEYIVLSKICASLDDSRRPSRVADRPHQLSGGKASQGLSGCLSRPACCLLLHDSILSFPPATTLLV